MASSLLITALFFVLGKMGHHYPFAPILLIEVAFTTFCWLMTAFITPATDRRTLMKFYSLVHPAGPGWKPVRADIIQVLAARSPTEPTAPERVDGPLGDWTIAPPPATEHLTDADIHLPAEASDHMPMAFTGWISGYVVI